MHIVSLSSDPDEVGFLVLSGALQGRIIWEFESKLCLLLHIKETHLGT
jgi:hypothetical protein